MENKESKFLKILFGSLKGATVCFFALFLIYLIDSVSKDVKIKKK